LTLYGDTPPLGPLGVTVAGEVPPLLVEDPVGGATPPVAAEALAVPHASATRSTAIANAERNPFTPCMGLAIGRGSTPV
jgi:hypothetical protein